MTRISFRRWRRWRAATAGVAALVLGGCVLGACAVPQQRSGAVVTVTGAIGETNRSRSEPFGDAFFNFHSVSFETGYAFDRAALAALGLHEVTMKYPNWPRQVTARGPRVADILSLVGATGDTVSFRALDGYTIDFDRQTIASSPAILAIDVDGAPLGIGDRGPAWLVFAPGDVADAEEKDDSALVWAIFHIQVH